MKKRKTKKKKKNQNNNQNKTNYNNNKNQPQLLKQVVIHSIMKSMLEVYLMMPKKKILEHSSLKLVELVELIS